MDDWCYSPPPGPLVVLHEDRDCVVVDKPSGLLSVPGRDPAHAESVLSRARARWPGALDVHRLDLDTSGLLVLATRRKAERSLKAAFRERKVHKRYIARVMGRVADPEGCIDLQRGKPVGRAPWWTWRRVKGSTRFRVLAGPHRPSWNCFRKRAVRITRVHMAAIGHPVWETGSTAALRGQAASRLLLHATEIRFPQPFHGTPVM